MQFRRSSVHGGRPQRCTHCGHHCLYCHGAYKRHSKADGRMDEDLILIPRYLCARCGHTCSVLPDDVLPYSPISVDLVNKHFDAALNGGPAPPVTEKEGGCLQRACKRFAERVDPLTAILGQMIRIIRPTAQKLWQALRSLGNLAEILQLLSQNFKTSLLGDYRCLKSCQ